MTYYEVHNCWPALEATYPTVEEAYQHVLDKVAEKGSVVLANVNDHPQNQQVYIVPTTAGVYIIKEVAE